MLTHNTDSNQRLQQFARLAKEAANKHGLDDIPIRPTDLVDVDQIVDSFPGVERSAESAELAEGLYKQVKIAQANRDFALTEKIWNEIGGLLLVLLIRDALRWFRSPSSYHFPDPRTGRQQTDEQIRARAQWLLNYAGLVVLWRLTEIPSRLLAWMRYLETHGTPINPATNHILLEWVRRRVYRRLPGAVRNDRREEPISEGLVAFLLEVDKRFNGLTHAEALTACLDRNFADLDRVINWRIIDKYREMTHDLLTSGRGRESLVYEETQEEARALVDEAIKREDEMRSDELLAATNKKRMRNISEYAERYLNKASPNKRKVVTEFISDPQAGPTKISNLTGVPLRTTERIIADFKARVKKQS